MKALVTVEGYPGRTFESDRFESVVLEGVFVLAGGDLKTILQVPLNRLVLVEYVD